MLYCMQKLFNKEVNHNFSLAHYKRFLFKNSDSLKNLFISNLLSIKEYHQLHGGSLIDKIIIVAVIKKINVNKKLLTLEIEDETGTTVAYKYMHSINKHRKVLYRRRFKPKIKRLRVHPKCRKYSRKRKGKSLKKKVWKTKRLTRSPGKRKKNHEKRQKKIERLLKISLNCVVKIIGEYRNPLIHPGALYINKIDLLKDREEIEIHRLMVHRLNREYTSRKDFYNINLITPAGQLAVPRVRLKNDLSGINKKAFKKKKKANFKICQPDQLNGLIRFDEFEFSDPSDESSDESSEEFTDVTSEVADPLDDSLSMFENSVHELDDPFAKFNISSDSSDKLTVLVSNSSYDSDKSSESSESFSNSSDETEQTELDVFHLWKSKKNKRANKSVLGIENKDPKEIEQNLMKSEESDINLATAEETLEAAISFEDFRLALLRMKLLKDMEASQSRTVEQSEVKAAGELEQSKALEEIETAVVPMEFEEQEATVNERLNLVEMKEIDGEDLQQGLAQCDESKKNEEVEKVEETLARGELERAMVLETKQNCENVKLKSLKKRRHRNRKPSKKVLEKNETHEESAKEEISPSKESKNEEEERANNLREIEQFEKLSQKLQTILAEMDAKEDDKKNYAVPMGVDEYIEKKKQQEIKMRIPEKLVKKRPGLKKRIRSTRMKKKNKEQSHEGLLENVDYNDSQDISYSFLESNSPNISDLDANVNLDDTKIKAPVSRPDSQMDMEVELSDAIKIKPASQPDSKSNISDCIKAKLNKNISTDPSTSSANTKLTVPDAHLEMDMEVELIDDIIVELVSQPGDSNPSTSELHSDSDIKTKLNKNISTDASISSSDHAKLTVSDPHSEMDMEVELIDDIIVEPVSQPGDSNPSTSELHSDSDIKTKLNKNISTDPSISSSATNSKPTVSDSHLEMDMEVKLSGNIKIEPASQSGDSNLYSYLDLKVELNGIKTEHPSPSQ